MAETPQNSILRISDAKTLQLIELYEKEQCLWDTSFEQYRDKEMRSAAVARIAKKLNIPHFTGRHVVTKFKNLRNFYCQELKRIAHSIQSGADVVDVYRPKVFWFSKMDSFLRPHLHPTKGAIAFTENQSLNLLSIEECKLEPEEVSVDESWMAVNPELVRADTSRIIEQSSEDDFTQDSRPEKRRRKWENANVPSPKIHKSNIDQEKVEDHLKDISTNLNMLMLRNDDYFDSFGKYIASLLRAMPSQCALSLQPKIVSLITSAMTMSDVGELYSDNE